MLIKTKIPKENPFAAILSNKLENYELSDFVIAKDVLEGLGDSFWVQQNNSKIYRMIDEEIKNGKNYIIKGKQQENNISYFLISEVSEDQLL